MVFDFGEFQNPNVKFRPLIRWWWPGIAVEVGELRSEINELYKLGFGGVEIQPFLIGGSGGAPSKETHRMAPNSYFFDVLSAVLDESSKHNMIVDLTLGSSWPPGGTQITKKDNLKTLLMGTSIVKGGKSIEMPVPAIQLNAYYDYKKIMSGIMGGVQDDFSKYIGDFKPVAVSAVKPIKKSDKLNFIFPKRTPLDSQSVLDITSSVYREGKDLWIKYKLPEGTWQIFSFWGGPTGMTPMSDAKSNEKDISLVVDILDSKAVNVLLEGFLGVGTKNFEKIEKFCGKTLRAIFTDSQEIADEWFWTEKFFDEFKERRGYDIRPYLPVCYVPNRDNQFLEVFFQNQKPCYEFHDDNVGVRIRHDWLLTLTDIWADEFVDHISKWGSKYGILHRIQTYGMPVDILKTFGASDIPETESLFSGTLDFFKVAGSAGIIYEKQIVSSETFSWMRKDLMTTPLKWKVACDRLFVSGINQIVYHGWSYQTPNNEYPARYPWAGHGFSENLNCNSTLADYYPNLNLYVSRVQYLLWEGKIQTNIGLFFQHFNYSYKHLSKDEDMIEGTLPGYDAKRIGGPIPWFMRRARSKHDKEILLQQTIGHQLMEYGYYYCHINEDAMLKARINGGNLVIGSARLKVIVFPSTKFISIQLAEKLKNMVNAGVKVIFIDELPDRQSGFLNYKENDKEIVNTINELIGKDAKLLKKDENVGDYIFNSLGIEPGVMFDEPQTTITYIIKDIANLNVNNNNISRIYFFRHGGMNSLIVTITLVHKTGKPYILDLWNGTMEPLEQYKITPKGIKIKLKFHPYGSKAIIFKKMDVATPNPNIQDLHEICIKHDNNYISLIRTKIVTPIRISTWNLNVNHRLHDGKIENLVLNISKLKDWRKIKILRYCSGPGIYKTSIKIAEEYFNPNIRLILELGKVMDVAKVKINGKEIATLLIPSYSIDITQCIKEGINEIEVSVVGTLQNRMIGYGKTIGGAWKKYAKRVLMPVGLIGPVKIVPYFIKKVNPV